MSCSKQLSEQRINIIINDRSKIQEAKCVDIVAMIQEELSKTYNVNLVLKKRLMLHQVLDKLKRLNPDVEYGEVGKTSFITPDGGFLYLIDKDGNEYPILITEVKTQGTNDARAKAGKKAQAKGNAIERLGKNVIVIKEFLSNEDINPFVCFGEGCDFAEGSTILDRVISIARFRPINTLNLFNDSEGSYFFREEKWSPEEMFNILKDVAEQSINYYKQKYGDIF